jgi:hypothetical protein
VKQTAAHAAAFAAQLLSLNALMLTNCSPQTQVALNRNALIENGTQSTCPKPAFRTGGLWLNCCLQGDAYPNGLNAGFGSVSANPEIRQPGNYYLINTDGIVYHNITAGQAVAGRR